MTRRSTFTQAERPRPPEAVLEAARALGRLMADRMLAAAAERPQPRPTPNPER